MGDPAPSFTATYRRADGETICDYGWVAHLEYFEEDDEPIELIEETWERTSVRRFWHLPTVFYDCDCGDCDEDAVAWEQDADGEWRQVCDEHRTNS